MANLLQIAVSKKKRRYQKNGFDLDLTYVTPRIIAMGFPSENMEAAYRNPFKEVLRFLDSFHKDHYRVYNLCSERGYEISKFYNRVACFPFDDHNAPPFDLIMKFCEDVQEWLNQDEKNIAVIHCKAGKGRTGLMISAWMLFSKEWTCAKDALTFYAAMRTYNKKGVTIPSQIRYVHYFEESLKLHEPIQPKLLLLNTVILHTIPKVAHISDLNFTLSIPSNESKQTSSTVFSMKDQKKDKIRKIKDEAEEGEEQLIFDCGAVPLRGDVKVEFTDKAVMSFWFNTFFVKDGRLVLTKAEIDKAHKDSKNKMYSSKFKIELVFSEVSTSEQTTTAATSTGTTANSSAYAHHTEDIKDDESVESDASNNSANNDNEATSEICKGMAAMPSIWILNKKEADDITDCPRSAVNFSSYLVQLLLGACHTYTRAGVIIGSTYHLDLVRSSRAWHKFVAESKRLGDLTENKLKYGPKEAIVFWINIHNVLTLHAALSLTSPPIDEKAWISLRDTAAYNIAGKVYCISEIESGIIRASYPKNSFPLQGSQLMYNDPRSAFVISEIEPRLVYALYRGTRMCPALRVYNRDTFQKELDEAVNSFYKQHVSVNRLKHRIWIPMLLKVFKEDFAITKDDILRDMILKSMGIPLEYKLKVNNYDWEFGVAPVLLDQRRPENHHHHAALHPSRKAASHMKISTPPSMSSSHDPTQDNRLSVSSSQHERSPTKERARTPRTRPVSSDYSP